HLLEPLVLGECLPVEAAGRGDCGLVHLASATGQLQTGVPEALNVLFEPAIVLAADLLERVQAHCCFRSWLKSRFLSPRSVTAKLKHTTWLGCRRRRQRTAFPSHDLQSLILSLVRCERA